MGLKQRTKSRLTLIALYVVILLTVYFIVSHFAGFGSFG